MIQDSSEVNKTLFANHRWRVQTRCLLNYGYSYNEPNKPSGVLECHWLKPVALSFYLPANPFKGNNVEKDEKKMR